MAHPLLPAGMPAATAEARPPLYFVNAPVDVALIGGLSIVTWAAMAFVPGFDVDIPILVAVLARVCNWPHFAATSYRLYRTRATIAQYPLTALLVPVVVGAAMVWAFAEPTRVAPMFVKLVLLWSPYHFSGQTLGVSLVYARRAGVQVTRATRLALSGVIYSAFAWATARAESGVGVRHFLGVDHPKLGVPPQVVTALAVALVVSAVVLALQLTRWSVRERRVVPPIVLLPTVAQLVWFVVGRDYERFQVLVPFFHSLQYLLVAWTVHLAERFQERTTPPSVIGAAAESARWWMGNVLLGLGLFALAPWLCTYLGYELLFAMAVTSSAVQLHHFFVDGVIWKLANPRVRSPLLGNVPRLVRPPVATPAREAA